MLDELVEAWRTNNRINLFLIDEISDEGMRCTLSTRGGRDVARQFAHIHNNRVWHMERRAKDLAEELSKFPTKLSPEKDELREALSSSCDVMESYFEGVLAGEPKRRGFRKGIFTTFGYFVAHESHHRGNILLTLKQSGHAVDKTARDAIWGWDQI